MVEHVRPNYGFVNGREVYFQRVSINPAKPELAQKEVHNAAWIFGMLNAQPSERELNSLVKVVGSASEDQSPFSVEESLNVLNSLSHVVDVDDERAIDGVFAALAA